MAVIQLRSRSPAETTVLQNPRSKPAPHAAAPISCTQCTLNIEVVVPMQSLLLLLQRSEPK